MLGINIAVLYHRFIGSKGKKSRSSGMRFVTSKGGSSRRMITLPELLRVLRKKKQRERS